MSRFGYVIAVLTAAVGSPLQARAEDGSGGADHARAEIGLSAGYGVGVDFFDSGLTDGHKVETLVLYPSWQWALTPPLASGSWLEGRLQLRLEGIAILNFAPQNGQALGAGALFRYAFRPGKRWEPFVEIGAGVISLDYDLVDQDDGLAFTPQGGIGLRYRLNSRSALELSTRFHHISNAGTHRPNHGIDSFQFLLGTSFAID